MTDKTKLLKLGGACERAGPDRELEDWRICAGTNRQYSVSNLGNVKRHDGLILKHSVPRNRREYPSVMLRHSGERHRVAVHRLVAVNFLGLPPFAGAEVRHLDGDHLNCHASNLAWGSRKDNAADRERHGTTAKGARHGLYGKGHKGRANGIAKLSDEVVRQIRGLAGSQSQRDISAKFGIHQATVWRVINRKGWAHVQ